MVKWISKNKKYLSIEQAAFCSLQNKPNKKSIKFLKRSAGETPTGRSKVSRSIDKTSVYVLIKVI